MTASFGSWACCRASGSSTAGSISHGSWACRSEPCSRSRPRACSRPWDAESSPPCRRRPCSLFRPSISACRLPSRCCSRGDPPGLAVTVGTWPTWRSPGRCPSRRWGQPWRGAAPRGRSPRWPLWVAWVPALLLGLYQGAALVALQDARKRSRASAGGPLLCARSGWRLALDIRKRTRFKSLAAIIGGDCVIAVLGARSPGPGVASPLRTLATGSAVFPIGASCLGAAPIRRWCWGSC